ncbi:hypothetical protein AB205_0022270 [Aquarana catesbeiana]|uniref:Uncharacterized protein n=1 Tax=Aquarana catesbeiana TaxID=8400 RepID=A0A2G9RA87_AQUCT|nr:hypothetical protein AB205_0022270 [Aquarana catesbeiana]
MTKSVSSINRVHCLFKPYWPIWLELSHVSYVPLGKPLYFYITVMTYVCSTLIHCNVKCTYSMNKYIFSNETSLCLAVFII